MLEVRIERSVCGTNKSFEQDALSSSDRGSMDQRPSVIGFPTEGFGGWVSCPWTCLAAGCVRACGKRRKASSCLGVMLRVIRGLIDGVSCDGL